MDIRQKLKQIGLTSSESTVYLYLLKNGLSTPPQIAKSTKITRTNVYHLLKSLQEKGLIQRQQNRNRFAYTAKNPDSLLSQAEHMRKATEDLLPDLKALHKTHADKPSIQFYESWDEVKDIYLATLDAECIDAIGSIQKLNETASDFFKNYQKQLKKRHVIFHDVLTADSRVLGEEMKSLLSPLYDVTYLPTKYGDLPTDMLIWDNHIALISFGEPVIGTVITNKNLADTFRALHQSLRS